MCQCYNENENRQVNISNKMKEIDYYIWLIKYELSTATLG